MKSSRDSDIEQREPPAKRQRLNATIKPIINVKLYHNPDTQEISIGFDCIHHATENLSLLLPFDMTKLPYNNQQTDGVEKMLALSDEHDKTFESERIEPDLKCIQDSYLTSVVCKLPTRVNAALNFLACLSYYINIIIEHHDLRKEMHPGSLNGPIVMMNFEAYNMQVSRDNLKKQSKQIISCLTLQSYDDQEAFITGRHPLNSYSSTEKNYCGYGKAFMIDFLRHILRLSRKDKKDDPYYEVTVAIDKILPSYEADDGSCFLDLMMPDTRAACLFKDIIDFAVNSEKSVDDKIIMLINLARELIKSDRESELTTIFSNIFKTAREKLCNKAIGQKADEGEYTERYTELLFVSDVECIKNSNGQLMWCNFSSNPAYQAFYAVGKPGHSMFEREIKCFAKAIGLQIEENCHFHESIIFTKESSRVLESMGFTLNSTFLQEIKQLIPCSPVLSQKNPALFFSHEKANATTDKETQPLSKQTFGINKTG